MFIRFLNLIAAILFCLSSSLYGQLSNGHADPFSTAKKFNKPVLLIFSGSDWCLPCQWLEKKIFSDSSFENFADRYLVIIKADFPQKIKLTSEKKAENEKLASEFNPDGVFPLLLLLRPERTVLTLLEYENYSAGDFINQVKESLRSNGMLKEYGLQAKLMGSAFEFKVTAPDEGSGKELLHDCVDEVRRIEKLLTEFSPDSETSLINMNAGKEPVLVSEETYSLLRRSVDISLMTNGAFDITAGVLKKLYDFKKSEVEIPPDNIITDALNRTGYKKIKLLPGNKVFLEKKGMHIGFGAIGKGYAADRVRKIMEEKGVQSGVINASGDLTAWGKRPNGENWRAGIAHPDKTEEILLWLPLDGSSIATSGDYEQFFKKDGIRYSHNIDPKSGLPVRGIKSVSVISPAAELSDALATAVTIMGIDSGLHMINQLPKTFCITIDENNKIYNSKNIDIKLTT